VESTTGGDEVRLRARLPVLWLGPTRVQIGTDPRWSVALDDLTPAATRALLEIPQGADERVIRAALRRQGVATGQADAVVGHLRAAALLVAAPTPESPDAAAWALMDAAGEASIRARSTARVRLTGLGRLGAGVATTLGTAGIGHLELDDERPVGRADICAGLTVRDVGTPRAAALARALHDTAPGLRTPPPGSGPVDLVVLTEHWVADPVRHRPLLADGVPHLSIVLREASILLGPLVRPGRSPCLRCTDLHRAELDPSWPRVAAQLAVARSRCPEETASAAVAGAFAAAQVLAFVDGRPGLLDGAVLEVRLPDLLPRVWHVTAHPECGCCRLAVG
jgi:hypothetical protein